MRDSADESSSSQEWSAERYARNARFVAELGEPVVDWLDPKPSERVLDVGCGDGALTASIVARGAAVVGIDASTSLVAAARGRGIDARVIDAYALPFHAEFDAAFSNAALHWMRDPDRALAGIRRALKPLGRFVGEMGAQGNVAAICTAILAVLRAHDIDGEARWPWYFPSPAEYAERLETHGFAVLRMELIPRPTPLPTGMRGWLDTFAHPFLVGVVGEQREAMLEEMTSLLAPSLRGRDGEWTADYVRLRFAAQLER
ncbi:MAG: methyltransferase domain-containing protein [Gemmatimonadota bacterium]|nr:methyltransferase domain-containing protein [Gemmatimonadota bacterium]